jgi:hypothetical protein
MTVRIAAANSVAKMFRAAVRRMLSRRFTISNLPAAIDGGAARVRRSLFRILVNRQHASARNGCNRFRA